MITGDGKAWLDAIRETVDSYRRMIDASVAQLSDEELHRTPANGVNSVAIILRHLGGNLRSRWTDFLTADGEKPDRHRDTEFLAWEGSRESLQDHFETGWTALTSAIDSLNDDNIERLIQIRGEDHTIAQALARSVTHISYHCGQIAIVARMVHQGEWEWLTVAPGKSQQHNEQTWGSSSSRSVFAEQNEEP